jgi:hypothetical protein
MANSTIDIEDAFRGQTGGGGGWGKGTILVLLIVLLFSATAICSTIIDYEWWSEVGQTDAWWAQFYYQTGPRLAAGLLAFIVLWVANARGMKAAGTSLRRHPLYARLATLGALLLGWILAAVGFSSWDAARYFASMQSAAPVATTDPFFGKPLTFYFFELPFFESLASFAVATLAAATIVHFAVSQAWSVQSLFRATAPGQYALEWQNLRTGPGTRILGALTLVALAAQYFLNRYDLAFEDHAFMTGVDYIAANVRIPLNWLLVGATLAAAGLVASGRAKTALAALIVLPIQSLVPGVVNSVYVKPNELTLQRPYIQHHMDATREAYQLKGSAKPKLFKANLDTALDANKHRDLLNNVRLWDWQAFHDTVSQIQPLRPYIYVDTDVDRYRINGKLQQVMLTPRELDIQQLGEARNRWPNSHVVYTHGYGIVAADANKITSDGLPSLFIQDAPPKVTVPGMKLTRPEIYYGEVAHEPVFVRTAQPEFNYPSGSDNVHNQYDGKGGFPIGSFAMRLIAAIAYADPNIVLTSSLQADSRMMIHRRVSARLDTLAGFLTWDEDPYLVLTKEGRLVWMVDGYTTSSSHPYSYPIRTRAAGRVNYVRNAVKATVDAYSGETNLYVFDEKDPIILAWRQLYPKLLKPGAEMPAELREHARYPEWLFRIQAEVHLTFHMQDAEAFYNKVDVWDIANRQGGTPGRTTSPDGFTEDSTTGKSQMAPTYVLADVPGDESADPEFLLMLPFTPRGKDNLIGMMIGRGDGGHLGELVFLELPKEQLYYGPMQIESRINQDQTISKDLTLWNQQGSRVLRGQMTVLPVDNKFFFAQPFYLQASQARMPQLKKVVIAVGNRLIYTDTYEQALAELGASAPAPQQITTGEAPPDTPKPAASSEIADPRNRLQSLRQRMERYRQLAAQGKWAEAGRELEAIETELRK